MAEELRLGRAGEAIKGGLLRFLEGGAPIRRGLAGLLQGDVEPLKQAVGYGQPFPQLTPEQMRQQAFDVAMDINNPMQNVGGLLGITAWHGSPHKFAPTPKNPLGEFDLNKMGSGEGAQVYGYGSYLAESPEVAKGYQIQNAYKAFDVSEEATKRGIPLTAAGRGEFIRQARANKDPVKAAKALQNANASSRSIPAEDLQKMFADYQDRGGGFLYKVDLPDEYLPKMLDWDLPMNKQPKHIQKAIKLTKSSLPQNAFDDLGGDYSLLYGDNVTPNEFLNTWESITGKIGSGEKQLANQGIVGIKYLDEGSRGNFKAQTTYKGKPYGDLISFPTKQQLDNYIVEKSKEGFGVKTFPQTSNFVVFDPSILNILERQ